MVSGHIREQLLASTALVGAAVVSVVGASSAWSQTTGGATPPVALPPSSPAEAAVEEVVVTGTLFRRTDIETPSPVTVLSADQISKQGITTISDAVRSISADNSGTIPTSTSSIFPVGAAGVALRGLTAADTLVLIDGLRTADYPLPDDGVRSFVDLNTIPFSIVNRVEILKDGASSIYGSDAVGGVVNIITKQTFKGLEADGSVGDSEHGGGFETRFNAVLGHGDLDEQGWNAYVAVEYQDDQRITVGQRGFPFNTNDLSSIGGFNGIGGQPGLSSGSIYGSVTPATLATPDNLLTGVPLQGAVSQPLRSCGSGTARSVDGSGNVYCAQNLALYGDDQPSDRRWGVDLRFTKQINPTTQAFVTAYYYETRASYTQAPAQIESSYPQYNTLDIALPPTLSNGALNPNNPFAAQGQYALINYAFGDIPSVVTEDNHMVRAVAGLKGDALGWNYEADLTVAHSWLNTTWNGYIDYDQLIADVNDGAYSFINPASNSAAVRSALAPTINRLSTYDMDSFDVHATRSLYQLPGGALKLAVGGQVRYEATSQPNLNGVNSAGNLNYLNVPAIETSGERTVGAVFAELDAPVFKQLDLDFSGRYDHYSDFGGNFAPKFGLKFTPFRQFAIRATYAQGFVAPSFSQAGHSSTEGYVSYDPSAAPAGSPLANFAASHGNDQYVQPYNLVQYSVGNPNLKPEHTESYTVGFIVEPVRFISASVDYYHIIQTNLIAPISTSQVLNDYYTGSALPTGSSVVLASPDPAYPNALRRVEIVNAAYVNANSLSTDGLDIDVRVSYPFSSSVRLSSELNFTDIFTFDFDSGGTTLDYVGTQSPYSLSSGAGTPKYRGNWSTTLAYGPATVTGTVYYTSGIKEYVLDVYGPGVCGYTNAAGAPLPNGCQTSAFVDFDLTGSYQISSNVQLYANILNLFDVKPPLDPVDYAGVNYNPTYTQAGIVGRFFRIGAKVKF